MGRRDRDETREPPPAVPPNATLDNITDNYIDSLDLPQLPKIPDRLEDAVKKRGEACLYHLRHAVRQRMPRPYELRMAVCVRDVISTANELGMSEAKKWNGEFRQIMKDLGYERIDLGYRKIEED
ncbi:MAG: hypothetical protein KJ574_03675 [Nanoarchaeota archaeon]|nr:hypothetical protein [Nanoarchaeota archaeon]